MRDAAAKAFGKRTQSTGGIDKGGKSWLAMLGALAASGVAYLIHRALVPKPRVTKNKASGDGSDLDGSSDGGDGGGD